MPEYIDRTIAIGMAISGRIRALPTTEDGEDWIRVEEVRESLQSIPAADVAPVVHGEWIYKPLDKFRKYQVKCSNCDMVFIGNYDAYDEPSDFNYCPNCGARMDG